MSTCICMKMLISCADKHDNVFKTSIQHLFLFCRTLETFKVCRSHSQSQLFRATDSHECKLKINRKPQKSVVSLCLQQGRIEVIMFAIKQDLHWSFEKREIFKESLSPYNKEMVPHLNKTLHPGCQVLCIWPICLKVVNVFWLSYSGKGFDS